MVKPWRCHYCGRTKEDHPPITCMGGTAPTMGTNMTGGAKPPRKEPKKG